jgi:hypothetical protein
MEYDGVFGLGEVRWVSSILFFFNGMILSLCLVDGIWDHGISLLCVWLNGNTSTQASVRPCPFGRGFPLRLVRFSQEKNLPALSCPPHFLVSLSPSAGSNRAPVSPLLPPSFTQGDHTASSLSSCSASPASSLTHCHRDASPLPLPLPMAAGARVRAPQVVPD